MVPNKFQIEVAGIFFTWENDPYPCGSSSILQLQLGCCLYVCHTGWHQVLPDNRAKSSDGGGGAKELQKNSKKSS